MARKPQPDNHPISMREVHVGADIENDALELGKAMEAYKNHRYRPYPTWSEVLEVAISLGYRKVAPPSTPIQPEPTTLPSEE